MAIEIRRVGSRLPFLRRYELRVTPPHAPNKWESPGPLSRRQSEKQLYEFGNHTADIGAAFAAADDNRPQAR
jgi:hypothetical protein